MNILRWLFRPRVWMPKDEIIDRWRDLAALGYTMQTYRVSGGTCCSFWLDGEQVTEWSAPITVDEMYRLRREWANAEWKRIREQK